MLDPARVAEVRLLWATGLYTRRGIERMTRVSRQSVSDIVSGRRPDYEAIRAEREAAEGAELGPLVRCAVCGGMQHVPCRVCRDRRLRAAGPRGPAIADKSDGDDLALRLSPVHRARYEEIHRLKQIEAGQPTEESDGCAQDVGAETDPGQPADRADLRGGPAAGAA